MKLKKTRNDYAPIPVTRLEKIWAAIAGHTSTGFEFYALSGASRNSNSNYVVDAYIEGRAE